MIAQKIPATTATGSSHLPSSIPEFSTFQVSLSISSTLKFLAQIANQASHQLNGPDATGIAPDRHPLKESTTSK